MNNYLYMYVDPMTGKPFYYGRGVNNRMLDKNHSKKVMGFIASLGLKLKDVAVKLIDGLTKDEAQLREASMIKMVGLDNLLNSREELSSNKYAVLFGLIGDKEVTLDEVIRVTALRASGEDGQTSKLATQLLWNMIPDHGSDILNPCGGMGQLLNGKQGTLVEIDNKKAGLAMASNSSLEVIHADYLEWTTPKQYDLIMMNPPFSLGSKMILKAMTEVKKEGCLAFIMYSAWKDTQSKHGIYKELKEQGHILEVRQLTRSEVRKYFDLDRTAIDLVVWKKTSEKGMAKVINTRKEEFSIDCSKYPLSMPMIPMHRYDHLYSQTDGIAGKTTNPDTEMGMYYERKSGVVSYRARIDSHKRISGDEVFFPAKDLTNIHLLVDELNSTPYDIQNFQRGAGAKTIELKIHPRWLK